VGPSEEWGGRFKEKKSREKKVGWHSSQAREVCRGGVAEKGNRDQGELSKPELSIPDIKNVEDRGKDEADRAAPKDSERRYRTLARGFVKNGN